jgi:hypothetical protein
VYPDIELGGWHSIPGRDIENSLHHSNVTKDLLTCSLETEYCKRLRFVSSLEGFTCVVTTVTVNNRDICPPAIVLSFHSVVRKVKLSPCNRPWRPMGL